MEAYQPEKLKELTSTLGNKIWRLSNLYKIRDKNMNLINLKPNNIQKLILNSIEGKNTLHEFYLKYRQGGVSTFWLLWWLDETIFTKNAITAILSHTRESLKYLWNIVKIAFDNMPEDLKPRVDKYNETTLSFPSTNSMMFVSLSIRSTAIHNLHISEICYIDSKELRATLAATNPKTNVTIESTANGLDNDGYHIYQNAKKGENGFSASFFPWYIQDEYKLELPPGINLDLNETEKKLNLTNEQILWRRTKQNELREYFQQEYPEDDDSAFLTTGNPFFDNKKILKLLHELKEFKPVEKRSIITQHYQVFKEVVKGHVYVAGADTAEGIGGDYSVLSIMDVTTAEQVFTYRSKISIDHFYRTCDKWCRYYNNALLAVERNNHGHAVLLGLYENMKYPNLYIQDREIRMVTTFGRRERKDVQKIGWETDHKSKVLMLNHLKQALEGSYLDDENNFDPAFFVYDKVFLEECLTLRHSNEKIESQPGFNDDTVMAWAICYQMMIRVQGNMNRSLTPNVYEQGILTGEKLSSTAIL